MTCDQISSFGNLFLLQPLDFESKRTHNVVVEAVNKHVDPRFVDLGSFRDQTIVRVSVSDVDEPPVFQPAEGAIMEVQEDAKVGAVVGIVTARDPDVKNVPVRYGNWDFKLMFELYSPELNLFIYCSFHSVFSNKIDNFLLRMG